MYVLSWWTLSALTQVLFWYSFPSLPRNQNNPRVCTETICHTRTYIIHYLFTYLFHWQWAIVELPQYPPLPHCHWSELSTALNHKLTITNHEQIMCIILGINFFSCPVLSNCLYTIIHVVLCVTGQQHGFLSGILRDTVFKNTFILLKTI